MKIDDKELSTDLYNLIHLLTAPPPDDDDTSEETWESEELVNMGLVAFTAKYGKALVKDVQEMVDGIVDLITEKLNEGEDDDI